jgi:sugar O-acyltransferase (sialic acid O-acetyltransferase NeuD family)
MRHWTVFGCGNLLSDIFDLIHSNGGTVRRVVNNLQLNESQNADLARRIALISEDVAIEAIDEFVPVESECYCFGFVNGRPAIAAALKERFGIRFTTLVHPTAHVGPNVHIGEGALVGARSILAPNGKIGAFAVINRGVTIGHDTELGDYAVLGPGVNVAGMVKVGREVTVGIGATVSDRLVIGDRSFVGAGAVAVRDVPPGVVVVGVPARFLRAV